MAAEHDAPTCLNALQEAMETHRQRLATTRERAREMMAALNEAEASFASVAKAFAEVQQAQLDTPQVVMASSGAGSHTTVAKRPRRESSASADTVASSTAHPISAPNSAPPASHAWLGTIVRATRAVADGSAPRAPFGGRTWHAKRKFVVADPLPPHHATAELPALLPAALAVVHAEPGKTMDAQALRATGSPPPGTAPEQAARLLLSGICDERQVFVGLRNMFMQSGVPAAMGYELVSIPGNGLCVWLVAALLAVRRDARVAQCDEPRALATGEIVNALSKLCGGALLGDSVLTEALTKIRGVDRDETWDKLSGETNHCGKTYDVCESLARGWNVHVPVLVLARHESLDAFSIAVVIYGDSNAPSIFGPRGGALVTYEASNGQGPLLSHVDVLVPVN